ncbi:Vacuolar protein sorting-associated protein 62 [Agyrium rufum]|nr:Vacuolar protein sorting-associated protein 62 [Agyrium rufum]
MGRHLFHVTPKLNYTSIQEHSPNLTELDGLNEWNGGHYVYLTSDDDPEEVPSWLSGEKNIPNGQPLDNIEALASSFLQPTTSQAILQSPNSDPKLEQDPHLHAPGHSHAPAILVVVPKANNITDAFWFYFYSFNLGNTVLNVRFGNHVGDWEHSMVRFENGVPTSMFFSEHIFGTAYLYEAVEKKRVRAFPAEQQPTTSSTHHDNRDKKEEEDEKVHENREAGRDTLLRPVVYSAAGTHANYATPGRHTYVLPFGLLHDETGRGPLWDPSLNAHAYTYDFVSDRLFASTRTPDAPTEWFDFAGHWGDRAYARDDPRQYEFVGQLHYVSGPLGPRFKDLRRERVCPGRAKCVVRRNRNEEGWRVWEGEGGDLEEGVD